MEEDFDLRQNFLSADSQVARDSEGTYFKVGDIVKHEGALKSDEATILSFEFDKQEMEVLVKTSRGDCHLDFIYKED